MQALAPATLANPQGGRVAAGSASIDRTSGSRLDVNQHSDRAVIDWRSFNIRSHEHTNFRQPSASAIALNRVQGSGSSLIDGRLTANGQVFLVNQNGVLFGKNARVDVAGLVATTADINNEDFMSGHYRFDKPSANPDAEVVNKGQIQVQDGGTVVLAAPRVSNEGLIKANLGSVTLAGARTYTLDFHGDGLLQFDAGSEVTENSSASSSDALVSNSGAIVADGGIVAMNARAADGVVDRVINMDGVIQARTLDVKGGTIILSGSDYGAVDVSGTLDVAGLEPEQQGGEVKVLGEKVNLLDGAYIDASAESGGGEVLVGGNYKGHGPEPNAKQTFVDEGATIKADANDRGDGGKIIVWADEAARIHGTLSARGGAVSGNGGFIETSSKKALTIATTPDASAPNGSGGTWLIDPTDITIVDTVDNGGGQIGDSVVDNDNINAALDAGTNVTITTVSDDDFEGNITQEAEAAISKTEGADATLTLLANNDIILNDDITSTSNSLNLNLTADIDTSGAGAVSINGDISTNGGDVTITSNDTISLQNPLSSGSGDITLTANEINASGAISGTGDLVLQPFSASLDVVVGGSGDTGIDALELGSDETGRLANLQDGFNSITIGRSNGTGTITVDPDGVTFNDNVTLQSPGEGGAIVLNGTITTTGSNFSVIGDTFLESDSSVSTGGGGITFDGLIDSAVDEGDPAVLTLDAVAGAIALLGNVGSRSALGRLTATGGSISLQDVTTTGTTGDQSYTGAVTFDSSYSTNGGDFLVAGNALLASDTSVDTDGGIIRFERTLNGGNALRLADSGDTFFGGDVGTSNRLGPVTIDGAGNITIRERFVAGDTRFIYSGNATSPVDSLNLTSLFLSPSAQGATLFGTVGGASGEDTALAVQGPFDNPDFTINTCVIGVACGQPVVSEPLQPQAEPIPPKKQVGLFGTTPSRTEARSLWAVYKRRPPSEDPTEPQYSNFGNEELWD